VDPTSTDQAIEHARDADVVAGEAAAAATPGILDPRDVSDSRHPESSFGAGIFDGPGPA